MASKNTQQIHRGAVFYVNLGDAKDFPPSSIQRGVRPAIIISNESCNRHSSVITILSCSSRCESKAKIPTHVTISANESGMKRDSIVLCEQPISIDKKDLMEYITTLNNEQMSKINQALRIQMCL